MELCKLGRNIAASLRCEVGTMGELGARKEFGESLVANAFVDFFYEAEILAQEAHEACEVGSIDVAGAFAVADYHALRGALYGDGVQLTFVFDVLLGAALFDFEERRLRNVNVAALDELGHVAEEE